MAETGGLSELFALHAASSVRIWIPAFGGLSTMDVDFSPWGKQWHCLAVRGPAGRSNC